MSAIITPIFRRNSVGDFKAGIEANNYYIGIGRLIPWPDQAGNGGSIINEDQSSFSEPLPQVTIAEEIDVRNELMALVKVKENSTVIPKNAWSSGSQYKRYDPTDPLTFELEAELYPCVTVSDNKIYLCLENNPEQTTPGESTFAPHINNNNFGSGNTAGRVGGRQGDGYVWAYIGRLKENSELDNNQFISISSDPLIETLDIQAAAAATGGLVYGYKIVETTANVNDSTLTIVLEGVDSLGAKIADVNIYDAGVRNTEFTIEGLGDQRIERVSYTGDVYDNAPVGYKKATVTAYSEDVNGVRTKIDGIKIIPLLAPLEGFGYDIKTHTPAHYIGLYARFAESVDGEALTSVAYRQISVLKNPQRRSTDSPGLDDNDVENPLYNYDPSEAIDCLDYFQISNGDVMLQAVDPGTIVIQEGTGAKAQIAHVDLALKRIYFQQQDQFVSNFLPFSSSDNIVIKGTSDITIESEFIASIYSSEYIHDTGEVLFIDNRKRINRNADQIEDLRIIIQF